MAADQPAPAPGAAPDDQPLPPPSLVDAIRDGRCVAFVGAGFAAPLVPSWGRLLRDLAARADLPDDVRRRVDVLLPDEGPPTAHAHEAAAQLLADEIAAHSGGTTLHDLLRDHLAELCGAEEPVRAQLLRDIPFQAIVTTNFDPLLQGDVPSPEAYSRILRTPRRPWWHGAHWDGPDPTAPPLLKLHGDVEKGEVVFTQRDYRRRLFGEGGYLTFLRSLLATRIVLYLGFSFRDAYLNQVRSEILSLVAQGDDQPPLAYALLADVSEGEAAYLRRHEGIEAIAYDNHDGGHAGFDAFLQALHDTAGHEAQLRRAVGHRHLLWVDPEPGPIQAGIDRLAQAMTDEGSLRTVATVDEARAALDAQPVDLVITHWGHGSGREAVAVGEDVLGLVRSTPGWQAPVVVFASGEHLEDNRPRAMRLGASDYVWRWADLFREVTRVLGTG